MESFEDKVNSSYYNNKPQDVFLNDLKQETLRLKEINKQWQVEFNKTVQIFTEAKSLESINTYKAIELYESITNT